ncbi:spermidine synthase [Nakamurella sp. YIM 132087]|uniref:Spermidine synthase n=1 Tax=Nakamurella alba TaxID=2665158 RepID=A0A7K1FL90_9ACTN|nr:fused MFS/spermidine synthase [Nakamurella alba]MTD14911.1 spermidine synthase [Nakamurella alba]
MRPFTAGLLVFFTSAAVLVMEILAARLLAPYVGDTLATYTGIIGMILAAIAAGTWLGGRMADRVDPSRVLGPVLLVGGALSLLIVPIVRLVGQLPLGTGPVAVLILVGLAFFLPAAVLSAVPPTVVKLQLADLATTGSTVGRISALGTAGAIVGTFLTGFLLVATWPTTPIMIGVAVALLLSGLAVEMAQRRARKAPFPAALSAVVIGVTAVGAAGSSAIGGALNPCQEESAYFCARVIPNLAGCPDGLTLYLDTLRHSCVHPEDPSRLDFSYTQLFADVITATAPDGAPLDAVHVGGGGFSVPRYLEVTHPGSTSRVLELDPALVEIAERQLGLTLSDDLTVTTGDARIGIRGIGDDTADIVLGDAFGGLSVPWHLSTVEWTREIDRVLRPDGVFVLNVIDYPPFGFARAEAATLQQVFEHVALLAPPGRAQGESGGNMVLVASHAPIDAEGILAANRDRDDTDVLTTGTDLETFIDGAGPLTDDYAPVDQLIAQGR